MEEKPCEFFSGLNRPIVDVLQEEVNSVAGLLSFHQGRRCVVFAGIVDEDGQTHSASVISNMTDEEEAEFCESLVAAFRASL